MPAPTWQRPYGGCCWTLSPALNSHGKDQAWDISTHGPFHPPGKADGRRNVHIALLCIQMCWYLWTRLPAVHQLLDCQGLLLHFQRTVDLVLAQNFCKCFALQNHLKMDASICAGKIKLLEGLGCFRQIYITSPAWRSHLCPLHYNSSTGTTFGMELLVKSKSELLPRLPGLHMLISYLTRQLFLALPRNQDAVHKTLHLKI